MPLFGHHAEGYFEIEIMGKPFPDGPTEHVLAFGFTAVALVLMAYGAFAAVRDLLRWRKRRVVGA
jgi:hypothetical protein